MKGAAHQLFSPLLSAKESAWSLVDWDDEQGLSLSLACGDVTLLIELERRDDTRPCFSQSERFNINARRLLAGDAPALTRGERAVVNQLAQLVREREKLLPVFDRPVTGRGSAVREIRVDRILVSEGAGQYYINPYVGCMIGCAFCYVQNRADFSRALAGLPELAWGRYVDVKVNAAEVLAREAKERPPGLVRMSPILTDPYQPLERKYRVTRACLEALLPHGFVPVILTRGARVAEDIDLLARFDKVAVGLSIPTDDDSVRQAFEPGADTIDDRLSALRALSEAGIATFGVVQPMLPMNAKRLVEKMAPYVRCVRIDRMHSMELALPLYQDSGHIAASTDSFFAQTATVLRTGFARAGVSVDELDDMAGLVELISS